MLRNQEALSVSWKYKEAIAHFSLALPASLGGWESIYLLQILEKVEEQKYSAWMLHISFLIFSIWP